MGDRVQQKGFTTLHFAAYRDQVEIVKLLLEGETPANIKYYTIAVDNVRFPLHSLHQRGSRPNCLCSTDAPLCPSTRPQNGNTPLFYAQQATDPDKKEMMIALLTVPA